MYQYVLVYFRIIFNLILAGHHSKLDLVDKKPETFKTAGQRLKVKADTKMLEKNLINPLSAIKDKILLSRKKSEYRIIRKLNLQISRNGENMYSVHAKIHQIISDFNDCKPFCRTKKARDLYNKSFEI